MLVCYSILNLLNHSFSPKLKHSKPNEQLDHACCHLQFQRTQPKPKFQKAGVVRKRTNSINNLCFPRSSFFNNLRSESPLSSRYAKSRGVADSLVLVYIRYLAEPPDQQDTRATLLPVPVIAPSEWSLGFPRATVSRYPRACPEHPFFHVRTS